MKKFYKLVLVLGMIPIMIIESTIFAQAEEYEYDDLNRVTKVIYEDGSYVEYEYDSNGNLLSVNVYDGSQSGTEDENQGGGGSGTQGSSGQGGSESGSQESGSRGDGGSSSQENEGSSQAGSGEAGSQEGESGSIAGGDHDSDDKFTGTDGAENTQEETEIQKEKTFFEKIAEAIQNFFRRLLQWLKSLFS